MNKCMLIAVLILTSPGSAQPDETRHLYYYWARLSAEISERLFDDLALSEAQRNQAARELDRYQERLEARRSASDRETMAFRRELILEIMFELDERVESDIDDGEALLERERARELWRQDVNPFGHKPEFVQPWNDFVEEHARGMLGHELSCRDEWLRTIEAILAESQLRAVPRAYERLEMNIYAVSPGLDRMLTRPGTDPRPRIDILRVIDEATSEGAELEPWAPVLRCGVDPDALDRPLSDVARCLIDFENAYSQSIRGFQATHLVNQHRYMRAFNEGRYATALTHLKNRKTRMRSILEHLEMLADSLGQLAAEELGASARDAWLLRFRQTVCPSLYAEDSVDHVASRLQERGGLTPPIVELLESYDGQRARLRETCFAQEIRDHGAPRLPLKIEPPTRESLALRATHESRVDLAKRTLTSLRAMLQPDDQAEFDQWLGDFRKQTNRTGEVRP